MDIVCALEGSHRNIPAPRSAVAQFDSAPRRPAVAVSMLLLLALLKVGCGLGPGVTVPLYSKYFSWQLKVISLPGAEQTHAEPKSAAAFSHLPWLLVLNAFPVALCSAKHRVSSRCSSSNHVFKSVRVPWCFYIFPFWHSGHSSRHINESAGRLLSVWMLAASSGWWDILIETSSVPVV